MSESEQFVQPDVEIGDTVYWALEGDNPQPAIVTAIGNRSLALSVVMQGMYNLHAVDGVPHRDDPRVLQRVDTEDGVWWHKEPHKEKSRGNSTTTSKKS